jgi:hypothetical protein
MHGSEKVLIAVGIGGLIVAVYQAYVTHQMFQLMQSQQLQD